MINNNFDKMSSKLYEEIKILRKIFEKFLKSLKFFSLLKLLVKLVKLVKKSSLLVLL